MNSDRTVDVKSLQRATKIIEFLQDRDGAGVSEVANELDMPVSTVHSQLKTLRVLGYVEKKGDKYVVGLRFLDFGMYARSRVGVFDKAREPMEELAADTGEIIYLMIERQGKGIYLDEARGDHGVETRGRIGKYTSLHVVAAGKAILAHLDRDRVDEIVDRHGLPAMTEQTITDREELYQNLETVRDRGYAINDNEDIDGIRAVGAPILVDGEVLGSISIGGPAKRFEGPLFEDELPHKVLSVTNTIELKMQY